MEGLFVRRFIFPLDLGRAERVFLRNHIRAVRLCRWHELKDRGMGSFRSLRVVVEHHQVPCPGETLFDPTNVVLTEEYLLLLVSSRIGPRVTPAIEEISSLFPAATGVIGGLLGRGAVVDDPD